MEITQIVEIALIVIGGATVALRIIAPLTANKTDDKILQFINKTLEALSLDSKFLDNKFKNKILSIKLKR